jgi:hypothetical protein
VQAGAQALVAGPNGVTLGRFGYQEPSTGQVSSQRTTLTQRLGFVLPTYGTWNRLYCEEGVWILREGLGVTLASAGRLGCRFAGGALPGDPVYASWLDGSASTAPIIWTADSALVTADSLVTADGTASELTQFIVETYAPPGCLAWISPWAVFSPAN